jgi:galactokinase/mevalonate kinase-like predicted kinase
LSEVDLFLVLKNIRDDSLITTISFDLSKIIEYIANKKKDKGTDDDIKYRFERMMHKISKYRRDTKMNKTTILDLKSKTNQNFFEFMTQVLVPSTSGLSSSNESSTIKSV